MPDQYYCYGNFFFVWDEEKNRKNIRKHGLDFKTAALVFEDDLRLEFRDLRHGYEEERFITIGRVWDIHVVSYCDRINFVSGRTEIRLISARLATRLEQNTYYSYIKGW